MHFSTYMYLKRMRVYNDKTVTQTHFPFFSGLLEDLFSVKKFLCRKFEHLFDIVSDFHFYAAKH